MENKLNVLILGATGRLGHLVTHECLKYDNLNVNIFIRDKAKNPELVNAVLAKNGQVHVGDIGKEEDVKDITKGIHTVVSCLYANTFEYQMNILKDGLKNGIQRFVPANFSVIDSEAAPHGVFKTIDDRQDFIKELDKVGVKSLNVINGFFHEWLLEFKDFQYYGTGDEEIPMTSYADSAKYVAAAVSRNISGYLHLNVEKLSLNQISELYENILGRKWTVIRGGTLEEGREKYQSLVKAGAKEAGMLGFFMMVMEGYTAKVNRASEFPEVVPTTFAHEYLNKLL